MARRALAALGLLALVALAGCSATGSLSMQPADDAEIAAAASRPAVVDSPAPDDRVVVRDAIKNGSGTATATDPPVQRGLPFTYEGRYYEVDWNVTGTEPGTAFVVGIDLNGTAPADETVAFEELSERDKRLLGDLLRTTIERDPQLRPGPEVGLPEEYTMAETNESVLLSDEYSAVRYNGTVYPFELEERERITLTRYRYTASRVADSTTAYAQQLRDEHLFRLSGLSEAERSVVKEAIDDVYYAEDTDDEAFRSVMDRFSAESAIEADGYDGTWLVRYDGQVYVAELSYGGFDQDDRPATGQ
jgi:predicted small lipoprotein YifL